MTETNKSRPKHFERLRLLQQSLGQIGHHLSGEVVLAPTMTNLLKVVDIHRTTLYDHGTSYEQKLEEVTGLTVVHTGIVLGNPDKYTLDKEFNFPPLDSPAVERLAEAASVLSPEDRERLIARLAINDVE